MPTDASRSDQSHSRHSLTDLSGDVNQLIDFPMSFENMNVFVECRTLDRSGIPENSGHLDRRCASTYLAPLRHDRETGRNDVTVEVQRILMSDFSVRGREEKKDRNRIEMRVRTYFRAITSLRKAWYWLGVGETKFNSFKATWPGMRTTTDGR